MVNSLPVDRCIHKFRSLQIFILTFLLLALFVFTGNYATVYAAENIPTQQGALVISLSAGSSHNCEIRSDNTVACWGIDDDGEASPPSGLFNQVAAGADHTCAIKNDGSLVCWGNDSSQQTEPPAGVFTQVTSGSFFSCAIKNDNTVLCWGENSDNQTSPPSGAFTQISAGEAYVCGIKSNGSLACWGNNDDGQLSSPSGTFKQISAGTTHACAIRNDNTVVCWGNNDYDQASPPAGTFKQLDAGAYHTCGIKTDGTVACWGDNSEGQATPPTGLFTQVESGELYSCGLHNDGSVVCWGSNDDGQAPTLAINPVSLPLAQVNIAYSQVITVSAENYTPTLPSLTLVNGFLPTGLTLNGTAGLLQGTPTVGGTFSFALRAIDDNGFRAETTFNLKINRAPVANNQNITVNPTAGSSILLTGSDADGDALQYVIVANPAHGTLTGAPPNMVYTPNASGSDSFTFKVNDGKADSNTATVQINIRATSTTNTPPAANGQNLATPRNTPRQIILTASDIDHNVLTYIVSNPAHGVLGGVAPNLIYTPTANFTGTDSFTFKVNDGQADSNVATININVATYNTAPVANDQRLITNRNITKSFTLTASDNEGDTLAYSLINQPSNGTLSGTPPNLTYTPNTAFFGVDYLTFKVNDGQFDSNFATVSITVTPGLVNVPVAPIADNQNVAVATNTPKVIKLTGSDAKNAALTYVVLSNPAHGTLSGIAPNLTYTPSPGFSGADNFTFKVRNGLYESSVATINIQVVAANTAPVANNQNVSTAQNTARFIVLSASDAEGNALTYSIVDNPQHGNLSGTAPNLIYTPSSSPPPYVGPDSFTFKVNDGQVDSNVATVNINVTSVQASNNTPPVAYDQNVTIAQDTAKTVTLTASDDDGNLLTYSVIDNPLHGTLSGTAPNLTYTPQGGYTGPDRFVFKVNDGQADSNIATVNINVTPGVLPQGSIRGIIFNDANGNGQRDNGEAGIANVTVTLKSATDEARAASANIERTTTTNADGVYEFAQVPVGNYTLQIQTPSNFTLIGSTQIAVSVSQSSEVTPAPFTLKAFAKLLLPLIGKTTPEAP